jgi:tRNA nucleotidyltransferase (CCA-adding enzyme)
VYAEGGVDGYPERDGEAVLEALHELPGGPELLELARERPDIELIGGATRDLLLGASPRELDIVLAGDVAPVARELAARLGGDPDATTLHERFGTATVSWPRGRIDIAARRSESYAAPGALPDVREGTPEEDLARRDFTINAIATPLGGPRRGTLRMAPHALEDLKAGRVRVLHERSFIDDPTRLLRLARYRVRLGFELEQRTAELAGEALAGGALATVSGARIGGELRLALAEPDPVAALAELGRVGVLEALAPQLALEGALARAALAAAPPDARPQVLLLACLILPAARSRDEGAERTIRELLDELEFTAGDREGALTAALGADALLAALEHAELPSQLAEALAGRSVEAIVLAGALGELRSRERAAGAAWRWLQELRHVRLRIGGEDLIAAGIAPGPEVGRRLDAAMAMRLDGELGDTAQEQLRAAMEGHA